MRHKVAIVAACVFAAWFTLACARLNERVEQYCQKEDPETSSQRFQRCVAREQLQFWKWW